MWEIWATIEAWLIAEAAWLGPLGGIVGTLGVLVAWLKWPFKRDKPTELGEDTINRIAPQPKDRTALTVPEFIRIRRELKADLEQELTEAAEAEKAQLTARIAELESQIANPEASLAEAQKRIADLEALLERSGNEIGGDRIAEARAALEAGDYSIADDIFAEIETRRALQVQEAARAAYGRGEIAEAEVRWADAAGHYARAAQLDPGFETLKKASDYAERAGQYGKAHRYSGELVDWCKEHETPERLSNALNEHAGNSMQLGMFEEAEALFREALEIGKATLGDRNPNYAAGLNNLALMLQDKGELEEAEGLFREALEIDEATLGARHPGYAVELNNLAGVLQAKGALEEAEALFREALEITKAAVGDGHPDYATRLNNLAGVLWEQGRGAEARPLWEKALEILRATLPPEHPHIANVELALAGLGPAPQE